MKCRMCKDTKQIKRIPGPGPADALPAFDPCPACALSLDELAYNMDREAHYAGDHTDPRRLMFAAAAAACRELSAQRSEGGYSAIRINDAKAITDAALAAWKGEA